MQKNRRKRIAAAMVGLAVIGICIAEPAGSTVPAEAAEASEEQSAGDITTVVVSWETIEKKFKVTVPTSVTVTLGTYSATCSPLTIKNGSNGAVCVRQVEIKNGDWKLDGYSGDALRYRARDSRYLGIQMVMGDSGITLETQTVTQKVTSQIWRASDTAAADEQENGNSGESTTPGDGIETTESQEELLVVNQDDSGEVVIASGDTLAIGCNVRATSVTKEISADNPESAAAIIFIIDWYEPEE